METKPFSEFGGLLCNKSPRVCSRKQAAILALRWWYWSSRLRPLVDELRSLPWRIALATDLPADAIGLQMPFPEGVEKLGLHEHYQRSGILGIEGLAAGNRWWGPRDTLVAFRAFRLGAMCVLDSEGIDKLWHRPQSAESTMNP
jgi:hypothetical protein